MKRDEVLELLRDASPLRHEELRRRADARRRDGLGDVVHLRGLLEVSNHCRRDCAYCGIFRGNREVKRYRLEDADIRQGARLAQARGYGTVVLQAGEDPGLTRERVAGWIRWIKENTPLAVTLSLGEREDEELAAWREAGADRYLLRFETSDQELYHRIHPDLPGRRSDRFLLLKKLRGMGYEIGSGVMTGVPGQSLASLADDLLLFRELDLDMIGVGPWLPHPATRLPHSQPLDRDQAPQGNVLALKTIALARILCPQANIPATTALATRDPREGRASGLLHGANVLMPNLTPAERRSSYDIYPDKAVLGDRRDGDEESLPAWLVSQGRSVGTGPGGRRRG